MIGETLKDGKKTMLRVSADEGALVCCLAHEGSASLQKALLAFDHRPELGFSAIPALLKARDGSSFAAGEPRCVYITRFVDGGHPEPSVETYAALGALRAQPHNVERFPAPL